MGQPCWMPSSSQEARALLSRDPALLAWAPLALVRADARARQSIGRGGGGERKRVQRNLTVYKAAQDAEEARRDKRGKGEGGSK